MRHVLALSVAALGVAANAALDMDHITPTASIISTPDYGVMQIFRDFPDFSGTVVDDFKASGNMVNMVSVAFELSNPNLNFGNIKGWRVSLWNTPNDAANSGNNLDQKTVATTVVTAGNTYTELTGTGAAGRAFRTDLAVTLNVTAGNVYWVGTAPDLDFTNNGQTFILSNTAPAVLGNGTANNSVGVNPSNGFGLGNMITVNSNAAYAVTTVPEPATFVALGLGLTALARRRRK